MLTRVPLGTNTVKILVVVPLILFLVSCGKNANSTTAATPSQQVTPSSVPQSRILHSVSIDVANIHIYSGEGIVCLNYPAINTANPAGLHDNLVLATDRLT